MYVFDIIFVIKRISFKASLKACKFKKFNNFFEGPTKSGWSLIRVNM